MQSETQCHEVVSGVVARPTILPYGILEWAPLQLAEYLGVLTRWHLY